MKKTLVASSVLVFTIVSTFFYVKYNISQMTKKFQQSSALVLEAKEIAYNYLSSELIFKDVGFKLRKNGYFQIVQFESIVAKLGLIDLLKANLDFEKVIFGKVNFLMPSKSFKGENLDYYEKMIKKDPFEDLKIVKENSHSEKFLENFEESMDRYQLKLIDVASSLPNLNEVEAHKKALSFEIDDALNFKDEKIEMLLSIIKDLEYKYKSLDSLSEKLEKELSNKNRELLNLYNSHRRDVLSYENLYASYKVSDQQVNEIFFQKITQTLKENLVLFLNSVEKNLQILSIFEFLDENISFRQNRDKLDFNIDLPNNERFFGLKLRYSLKAKDHKIYFNLDRGNLKFTPIFTSSIGSVAFSKLVLNMESEYSLSSSDELVSNLKLKSFQGEFVSSSMDKLKSAFETQDSLLFDFNSQRNPEIKSNFSAILKSSLFEKIVSKTQSSKGKIFQKIKLAYENDLKKLQKNIFEIKKINQEKINNRRKNILNLVETYQKQILFVSEKTEVKFSFL
ncbi:hypothetical protein N9O57_00330 [bacterium]|nr:hypothetical protein [bacterium]